MTLLTSWIKLYMIVLIIRPTLLLISNLKGAQVVQTSFWRTIGRSSSSLLKCQATSACGMCPTWLGLAQSISTHSSFTRVVPSPVESQFCRIEIITNISYRIELWLSWWSLANPILRTNEGLRLSIGYHIGEMIRSLIRLTITYRVEC